MNYRICNLDEDFHELTQTLQKKPKPVNLNENKPRGVNPLPIQNKNLTPNLINSKPITMPNNVTSHSNLNKSTSVKNSNQNRYSDSPKTKKSETNSLPNLENSKKKLILETISTHSLFAPFLFSFKHPDPFLMLGNLEENRANNINKQQNTTAQYLNQNAGIIG